MSAPHPSTGGATDAEIAAALAALLAVASSDDSAADSAGLPAGHSGPAVSAWRRATGPLPDAWTGRGWRAVTRPRTWS